MKTKNPNVLIWRQNHHAALKKLASPKCKLTGLQIWRKLRRLEQEATTWTTAYCNGECGYADMDMQLGIIGNRVIKVFSGYVKGFFINRDPRGYTLKLDPEKTTIPDGMHKDFGGYGVLAAEING